MQEKHYKLSEFAQLANVSVNDLKRWNRLQILPARRIGRGYRFYLYKDLSRLHYLQKNYPVLLTRKVNTKYKDLTGFKFGYVTVLNRADDIITKSGHRNIQYLCKCICGNKFIALGASLQSGYTKSCGCRQYGIPDIEAYWNLYLQLPDAKLKQLIYVQPPIKPRQNVNKHIDHNLQDLSGQHFYYWTVIKRGPTRYYKNGGQAVCWLCKCVCGNIKVVPGRDLKSGASKSCGCMSHNSYFLEYNVENYLQQHHIDYKHSWFDSKLIGTHGKVLHFDFAIYANKRIIAFIECQGIQHYQSVKRFGGLKKLFIQQVHDDMKKQYADKLNIPLFYVPYTYNSPELVNTLLDSFNFVKSF